VRHVHGVYEVLAALRAEFPGLLIESCAGGGGRADLGILRFADQVWPSDNTEAADRLHIQYGYTHAYPARTMACWVTDVPNLQSGRESPLEFRFHVAMQGALGIGGDIRHWTDDERRQARALIAEYKRIRPVVQLGRQYWLAPPTDDPCGVQYVSKDGRQTVALLYQVRGVVGQGRRRFRLCGLDPALRYRRAADGAESTGATLMAAGIPADFPPPEPLHTQDRRSRMELWEAVSM
jgi:alpha-galactosidase